MIKLSDYLVHRLVNIYGVDHVFMISGGGAMHLNDSFGNYPGMTYTCNHHEQASAIAAEGYSRYAQRLSVVNVTTGPGGINALNGVYGQWTDSVPVLYLSGQVKRATTLSACPDIPLRQLGDQEVDIIRIVSPIVKYAYSISNPRDIKWVLDRAVSIAQSGRPGPVWVDIPMDIQSALIDESTLLEDPLGSPLEPIFVPLPAELLRVYEALKSAKRPLIVAGHGIRLSHSESLFYSLLDYLGIPVVTSLNGFDSLEETHPCYVGRIGTVGQRVGNFVLQQSDVILFLGTRNNIRQISYNWENFAPNAMKIVVDVDLAELQKPTLVPNFAIHSDLKVFLERLLNLIAQDPFKGPVEWLSWTLHLKHKYHPLNNPAYFEHHSGINPYFFCLELTRVLKEGACVVAGNGSAIVCMFQAGCVKKDQRFIWNSGDASMGYDLPAAIGACMASRQEVVCLAGDGSLMMNLQELQTMKHYHLPLKLFILNNDGYVSIQQTQKNFFNSHFVACTEDSGVTFPDFIHVAESFGLPALRLNSPASLAEDLSRILDMEGPVVCEIMLDRGYAFTPKLSARKLEDGTMVSPSLEDMFPFLSSEELEAARFLG